MKAISVLLCSVVLCVGVRSAWADSSVSSAGQTVAINGFAFAPQVLTVLPGTTVTWINHDQTAHSVISQDGKFASRGLDTDDRYTFTFEHEGDYAYFCSLHPQMIGAVHVRAR